MAVKLQDFGVELEVLAAFLQGPHLWKNIPEEWFQSEVSKKAYREFKKFQGAPYHTFPTLRMVEEKTTDPEIQLFCRELSAIVVDPREFTVRLHDLFSMYASRRVYDVAKSIPDELEREGVEALVRKKISVLSGLVNPFQAGLVKRSSIYDTAIQRWEKYKQRETNGPEQYIPYCIKELDQLTNGGIRKGHMVMFFALTGGFKTRTKANLAYNFAFIDKVPTAVMTLEVPKEDYELIIDSRNTLLPYNDISAGNLGVARALYRDSLKKMVDEKTPLFLIDLPDKATPADMIAELELYFVVHGYYPDVLILDYANEMEPNSIWSNTSEKFKNLGSELRRIARSYNVAIITSMQENREGKKIKDVSKHDLEHVGESHYFSNACHLVVHLYQDASIGEDVENILHMSIKKNRYGKKDSFTVFANAEYNYVGDRTLRSRSDG